MESLGFLPQTRPYQANDFVFKIAKSPRELTRFQNLRRDIFCEEQQVFEVDDVDEYDRNMIPIVAESLLAGMDDEVVGVVRIDEREPGVWWGSRLGVHRDYRILHRMATSVAVRNHLPAFSARRSIGAGLIYKAVSTAQALGCQTFLAHVQSRNAPFFRRLHWDVIDEVELYGISHVKMRADLEYYPAACHDIPGLRAA
jgi:predicted GNAT family N-acyltransferase